jgi:hypothetical protein
VRQMSILSKFKSKHVWNNQVLKHRSELCDKGAIASMLLIILSAWLAPQYFPENSKAITLVFVAIGILLICVSWFMEKQDDKYAPPPSDNPQ